MLLQLAELACNKALEHDLAAQERMRSLHGKWVALEIKEINRTVHIAIKPHGLELLEHSEQSPHVTLSATPAAMLKIARQGMEDAELEPGDLEINGDPIVAQRFATLASNIDVDWEAFFAEHLGEVPAAFLSRGLATARSAALTGRAMVKQRIRDSLKSEMGLFADGEEVESFLDDVDELRGAVDRLEARLKRVIGD